MPSSTQYPYGRFIAYLEHHPLTIDNVLKPLLLGHKAPAPMLVVFLGAIGGFISFGIIGLFAGAVVLSLGMICLNCGSPIQLPAGLKNKHGTDCPLVRENVKDGSSEGIIYRPWL